MAVDLTEYFEMIEEYYGNEYNAAQKVYIEDILSGVNIDFGKLVKKVIENESTGKWKNTPPDVAGTKDYIRQCIIPREPEKQSAGGVDRCRMCKGIINFRHGVRESYKCSNCGSNAMDMALEDMERLKRKWKGALPVVNKLTEKWQGGNA